MNLNNRANNARKRLRAWIEEQCELLKAELKCDAAVARSLQEHRMNLLAEEMKPAES